MKPTWNRRDFLRCAGLAAGAWTLRAGPGRAAGTEARPNILYIMSDDHAAHAISAYGSRINRTPNIDRLAKEGLRLDRCFATNSICTPSRATILTGQYSHRNGVPIFNAIDPARPNVAKLLKAAGYHTGMVGKWHLFSDPSGFDEWEILPGQGDYWNPLLYTAKGEHRYTGYVTGILTDLAIQRLEHRPKDRPFFLMVHHKAPHRNWQPEEKYVAAFKDRAIPEPPTLFDTYEGRSDALREQKQSVAHDLSRKDLKQDPPTGLEGEALVRWKYRRYLQDYLACVQSVDDSVGRLLDWIDTHGLKDNTLVIYTSDQGFFLGDHGLYDKRFMYEESIRMPFLARAPGRIVPGTTSDALAINCDFAPTFLDLAGAPVPADMQGRSLRPLFNGGKPDGWRTSFYYRYYHDPGDHNTRAHYGVRTETHKLIYFWKKDQWECYDLLKDPEELHNIYAEPSAQPVVAALKKELARLKLEVQDRDEFANELPAEGKNRPARPREAGPAKKNQG